MKSAMKNLRLFLLVLGSWTMNPVTPFSSNQRVSFSVQHQQARHYDSNNMVQTATKHSSLVVLYDAKKPQYSREVLLREEAESPFRKVRFFFIATLAGGATISVLVSLARIAAGLSGINADLLPESLTNAGIDIAGLVVLGFLWRNDIQAQDSRLKRATKGAELAALRVRLSNALAVARNEPPESQSSTLTANPFSTTLASLRQGRGIEKRVVIAAAGPDKIQQVVQQAQALNDSLTMNDLLIVPVVLPQAIAPANLDASNNDFPECLALPIGPNWQKVVEEEAQEALKQNVDIEKEGFCVVLKKNGRVGTRTRGIFLQNMVGEVIKRKEAGMDVKNI
jgi:hypothetical protein